MVIDAQTMTRVVPDPLDEDQKSITVSKDLIWMHGVPLSVFLAFAALDTTRPSEADCSSIGQAKYILESPKTKQLEQPDDPLDRLVVISVGKPPTNGDLRSLSDIYRPQRIESNED